LIDYEVLKILWWMAMGAVLVIYAGTAGYDSGVTMIMPFLRKEIDRRVMLNTSAPTDLNTMQRYYAVANSCF